MKGSMEKNELNLLCALSANGSMAVAGARMQVKVKNYIKKYSYEHHRL